MASLIRDNDPCMPGNFRWFKDIAQYFGYSQCEVNYGQLEISRFTEIATWRVRSFLRVQM